MSKPLFQRRHYNRTAAAFRKHLPPDAGYLIELFVQIYKEDNPNFDPERFRRACQPEPGYEVTVEGVKALLKEGAR
jgi:hypothetical protein